MIDATASLAKQRVQQFHVKHGGICFELDGFYWYPDGAYRDVDLLGVLCDGPTLHSSGSPERLEYDLAVNKLRFCEAKCKKALGDFKELRQRLEFSLPNDEKAAIRKLKELGAIAQAAEKELRKAQAAVDSTSIGKVRKLAASSRHEEAQRVSNWRNQLNTVKI